MLFRERLQYGLSSERLCDRDFGELGLFTYNAHNSITCAGPKSVTQIKNTGNHSDLLNGESKPDQSAPDHCNWAACASRQSCDATDSLTMVLLVNRSGLNLPRKSGSSQTIHTHKSYWLCWVLIFEALYWMS